MWCGGRCVSLVWGTLSVKSVWISFFLVTLHLPGVVSEMCVYRRNKFNSFTERYDKILTTKDCQWGCCYNSGAPCCSAPVSLIVGVVLGSVLIFAMIVAVLCCCCVCRKNQQRAQGRRAEVQASSSTTQQTNVIFHSETSQSVPDYMRYSDAPPSYDEVMSGEINHAFKPETT